MPAVKMPQLGESITEGTINKWLKKPGDQVKKYESLVEVMTDKVNAEVPSPIAGVLKEIKAKEGTTVSVGTEIAVIDEVGSAQKQEAPRPEPSAEIPPEPAPVSAPPTDQASDSLPLGGEGGGGGAQRLSPAVRALIQEHHISASELARISGSGIGGRISKKDIESYVASRSGALRDGEQRRVAEAPAPAAARPEAAPAATRPEPAPTVPAHLPGEVVPLSPMRRAIAVNMAKSKQTIPHAWTVAEVDMTSVVKVRQQVRESFRQREGVDLSYVPFVVQAVIEALKAIPVLNASWSDDGVVLHKDINIGIAVSIEDGLIVPVIKNADRLSIAGIAKAADDLAKRARANKLSLQDVQGATFTVNNPGTFGTILSNSIIAPPQAGILAMDAVVKRPVVVEDDAIAIRSMMNLCLSFDHRVLDGVSAARFLQTVRRSLETFTDSRPIY